MNPLWIIDISGSEHSRLKECIAFFNGKNKECWTYTQLELEPLTDVGAFCRVRKLLLDEAKSQVNQVLERYGLNGRVFNVCVLGDILSETTRSYFPFVSVLLRRHRENFFPINSGSGLVIDGLIYIPTNLNQCDNLELKKQYCMFFEILNAFRNERSKIFYDCLIPFGDIQPVGHQDFLKLNVSQRDELIYQNLLHLYSVSGRGRYHVTGGRSNAFSALGTASFFFEKEYERERTAIALLKKTLELFCKENSEIEQKSDILQKMKDEIECLLEKEFKPEFIHADKILKKMTFNGVDISFDLKDIEKRRKWRPIRDFYQSLLLPMYYLGELKFLPARLKEYVHFYIHTLRQKIEKSLKSESKNTCSSTCKAIDCVLDIFWTESDYRFKTLSQVEALLKEIKERILQEEVKLKNIVETTSIQSVSIPDFLQIHVEEIQNSPQKITLQSIVLELKNALQETPTFLGAMVRTLLIGTTGVFCILPFIKFVSPRLINLGEISEWETFWILLIYLLPFVYTLWWIFGRHFRRIRNLKNKLWAYALLKLRKEMNEKLVMEAMELYNQLKIYCEEKIKLCGQLRKQYSKTSIEAKNDKYLSTFFSRSIVDYLKDRSVIEEKVMLDKPLSVSQLSEGNLYELLYRQVMKVGSSIMNVPIIEEERNDDTIHIAFVKKVNSNVRTMLAFLQTCFIANNNMELNKLIGERTEDNPTGLSWKNCLNLAYPCGIFIDDLSTEVRNVIITASLPILSDDLKKYQWEENKEMEKDVVFVTSYQEIDEMYVFRILGNISSGTDRQLMTDLAAYYLVHGSCRIGERVVDAEFVQELVDVLEK